MANHNPNTSGLTPFKPGQSGNPGGKTSEHRKAEIKAAELAAMVQADLVEALYNTLQQAEGDEAKLGAIKADVLKLLKDSQDRGFGSPQQRIDNTSSDGSMTPAVQTGDAVLDALQRKHAQNNPESDGEAP
jgi:hypothetical protein